jgi:outer membrane protein
MKIRFAAAAFAVLMFLPASWAQTGAAAPAAGATKIGVLNVQLAIASTAEGKQDAAQLQAQFAPRQTELEQLSKEIDDIRNRLRTASSTLSDDERSRLALDGDQKSRLLQRKQQELQDDGQEAQREVFDSIGRKMVTVLDSYAKLNGFGVIIDSSSQSSTVVYAAPQTDISQDIIRLYDQSYPLKAGSAAPSSPAPARRPAGAASSQPKKP